MYVIQPSVKLSGAATKFLLAVACAALAGCAAQKAAEVPEFQLVWPAQPEQPRYFYERTIASSGDLGGEQTFTARLQQIATGVGNTGRGMEKPFGVVAVNGRVFVGDSVGRRVEVYDIAGKRFYDFGTSGTGTLSKPLGIAADQRNRIYVVDATAKKVQIYDLDGKHISAFGTPDMFDRPSGIAVNADGSRVYVVDTGGVNSQNHRVRVFNSATGEHLFDFGERGSGPGQFNLPNMATVGPDGSVYISDGGNFRIEKFSPDGTFLMAIGNIGRRAGQFARPKGVAVDKDGNVFVADAAFGNFQIFNKDGQLLMHVGQRDERGGPGQFLLPAGIAADRDGRIYIVDQFFKKLEVYRPASLPAERPRAPVAPS
jgi:DNA-binding beta-propeller fold protein YncE